MRYLLIVGLTLLAYATPGFAVPDQLLATASGKILFWFNLVFGLLVFVCLTVIGASVWDRLQQRRLVRHSVSVQRGKF